MVAKRCLGYAPRVLLHAANLRHGTDNFTSLPKEGVLRIFYRPLKIQRLRPGLNPRTWVSGASALPLHHRSRLDDSLIITQINDDKHTCIFILLYEAKFNAVTPLMALISRDMVLMIL